MSLTVFVPRDSTAQALGAEKIAAAIAAEAGRRSAEIKLLRNGSRGLFWLEPLVEVVTPAGRVGYGPVGAADVPSLFESDFLHGGDHPLRVGAVENLPYLRNQQRLSFARMGITDPLCIEDYAANGGFAGLRAALELGSEHTVQTVTDPACAAWAVPRSPPASNGRPRYGRMRRANTWWATPTKAIPARSPTA